MSSNANDLARCPKCGEPVTGHVAGGLCPRCLLKMHMATRTEVTGEAAGSSAASPARPQLTPDEVARFFPQFEILGCLGRGGMGVVYKARQKSLNRLVALKILAPEREKDAAFARRFAAEAETLAKLNHPNIITVHDFGEAGGMFYLVMEFVDGVNLRQLLKDGKLSPEEALAIVPPVCDALQYAHNQRVVHRDIKPENLLLDKEGRIKIADFGIARILANGGPAGETRSILGTPNYMAPEQLQHPERVDHRADIFSLGAVLYEMLTGEPPAGNVVPPSRKVHIDVRLDEIVLRALEQEPELRYQQAKVLKTDVETFAAAGLTGTRPISKEAAPHEVRRPAKGSLWRPLVFGTSAVVLIMLGIAIRLAVEMFVKVPERTNAVPIPQVVEQLRTAGLQWKRTQVDLLPDSQESFWQFAGLNRLVETAGTSAFIPLHGTLTVTAEGSGRWHARGAGDLNMIDFEVARTGSLGSSPLPGRHGFGPVVERVIRRQQANEQGFVFFDMETGHAMPAPFPLVLSRSDQGLAFVELSEALEQWIRANRMDVLIQFSGENWSSMNLRMQEDFLPEAAEWGQVTATVITNVFDRWDGLNTPRPAVPSVKQGRAFNDQFDRTKAFRTRSNTLGIMEWAGQTTTPQSVKVRYRLVEGSNPDSVKYLVETSAPR